MSWRYLIIHPDSVGYKTWYRLTIYLTAIETFLTPFYMSFGTHHALDPVAFIEHLMDAVFIIDLVITSRLAYYRTFSKELVADPRAVWAHYLRQHLLYDTLAAVPFDTILEMFMDIPYPVRFVRVFRLLRVDRMWKIMGELERNAVYDYYIVSYGKIFFLLFMIGHWSCCLFFFLYRAQTSFSLPMSWGTELPFGQDFATDAIVVQYITSLYWAFATLSTVGYGDVTPVTPVERVISVVLMMVNLGLTAYILGNVTLLTTKQDA